MDDSSSSTINTTKTESTSSIEQTLPLNTKMPMITHRFISKKNFKPETCFVVSQIQENFFCKFYFYKISVSNELILVQYHIVVHIVLNQVMLIVKKMQI